MDLSVVIPVRNRPALVRQCVEGVLACDYPRERFEVIVVDNGSTDDTAGAARQAGARVIEEPVANRCLARNRGAGEAHAPWVAFIDSDCVPEPDWLARLAATIDALGPDSRVANIAGSVAAPPPRTPVEGYIELRGWFDQDKYVHQSGRFKRPFALTANLTVRRDVYLELGGLDLGLPYPGEDADWCWRAAAAGWELLYVPQARVIHHHRATLGGLWVQSYHWGVGQADLFAKWKGEFGATRWVEPCYWEWALKGLLKAPFSALMGETPLERRTPFCDFVANAAMAAGRVRGGIRSRTLVI